MTSTLDSLSTNLMSDNIANWDNKIASLKFWQMEIQR